MEGLKEWLRRLSTIAPSEVERVTLRMFVPGKEAMDLDNWIMTTEQPTEIPFGLRGSFPQSATLLAYPDSAGYASNAIQQNRLSADIAAVLSLALERQVDIPYELAVRIGGHNAISFLPVIGVTTDRVITGPIPKDYYSRISQVIRQIAGLADDDIAPIGAAASMFHGALLLHDRDLRSAYTLVVAGIEVLSRKYGQPPTAWDAREHNIQWDAFITSQALSVEQANALRRKLMDDKQLRLKGTFRSYGSERLRDSFWEEPWIEWLHGFSMGNALAAIDSKPMHEGRISDFLPSSRSLLSKALGHTYDLRSRYVHRGAWSEPMDLMLRPAYQIDCTKPLPFAVARAILRELICAELTDHSRDVALPDVVLHRNP
jgi:hypothetical protein